MSEEMKYLTAAGHDEMQVFKSSLLRLPGEIKLEVLKWLDCKRDLYNLSMTCRAFESIVMHRLYEKLDIEVPDTRYTYANGQPHQIATLRPSTLMMVKELQIRHRLPGFKDSMYNKVWKPAKTIIESHVSDLLDEIPIDQLTSFSFLHHEPLSVGLLRVLAKRQRKTLANLHLFEIENFSSSIPPTFLDPDACGRVFDGFRSIQCHSLQSGQMVGQLIQASKDTLECLYLGQEKGLAEAYRRTRVGFLDQIQQPSETFYSTINLGSLPRLRSLTLVGLDITPFVPRNVDSALYLRRIEHLTIESCAGVADFLNCLASTYRHVNTSVLSPPAPQHRPQLKSFKFRQEAFGNLMKDALLGFLTSFEGLENLSLLFENATLIERPSIFIANHGRTLKVLVLECRIQPREHLGLDTSRPFGSGGFSHQLWQDSINDICETCPDLVELGMGFPWDDELVRVKKTKLLRLHNLHTIHVRNFPQSQVLSQLGDYAIQEHARRFVEWCFPSRVGGAKPGLGMLAIGPTLYETRWKCDALSAGPGQTASSYRRLWNPPEYLRTHYFCVDWAKTRFGRWNAMITPVSERYTEEIRGETPLAGVFEQVWLR